MGRDLQEHGGARAEAYESIAEKRCDAHPYFPLFVDLWKADILFVGAGTIAARRILALQPFASRITVVAPDADEEIKALSEAGSITWIRREFRAQDLEGRDSDPDGRGGDLEGREGEGASDGPDGDGPDPTRCCQVHEAQEAARTGRRGADRDARGQGYRAQSQRDLVLVATDDRTLNEEIASLCKARRIPVNVASDKSLCDFYFPGILQKGEIVVGISASGQDHSKARRVREQIQEVLRGEGRAEEP